MGLSSDLLSVEAVIFSSDLPNHVWLDVEEVVGIILEECLQAAHFLGPGFQKDPEFQLPFLAELLTDGGAGQSIGNPDGPTREVPEL